MANYNNNKYAYTGDNLTVDVNVQNVIPMGSKLTRIGVEDGPLIDAFNIDWTTGDYYFGDVPITSTGQLIEEINSKVSESGDVWDDIKDSAYITQQINIYASYTTSKSAPSIDWGNQIDTDYDNITSYSTLPSSSTTNAQGWYTSVDDIPGNNQYVFMSSAHKVLSLANDTLAFHGPTSTPIYLPSENGINGNFKSTVFCRTNTTPKAPSQGAVYSTGLPTTIQAYNSSNAEITGVEWSDGIPSGQEILWASTGIIEDSSPNETVWSTPRQMTDTATYDVEFAFEQENDATPATPTDSNRHGGSGTQIWFDPANDASQDFTQMYWRAERECINGEWGDWIIVRIKGEQGTAGIKGDFKSTVFKRSENQPEAPSGGDYDHPVPSGWYDGIPNGTGPVWSTWKTFSANDNNSSWTTPALVADTPTYDVEFSPYSNNNNTSPRTTENIDTSNDWFDPTKDTLPENITWENMIWRAERNRATSQDAWSTWVITKIKGEDGHVDLDMPYYEQRWRTFENTASVPSSWDNSNLPYKDNSYINVDDSNGWTLVPNYSNGGIVYMTSCKVIIDVIDNAQTKRYNGDWPTPIRVTGIDGKANPIQPVLKYQWHNTNEYSNAPSCSINSENPGINWLETPGNPLGENKYLWMIQGQRQDNSMQTIDGTNYWTSPVCLSGADGEPGVDGDDIEFIYHIYNTVQVFGDSNDNPSHWEVSSQDNYLGPDGYKWTNHPTGVTLLNKYEYCSYRRKTGTAGNKQWTTFSEPFAWSIYGENGIDGDGVEYIYAVTPTDVAPTQPEINPDNYTASQQSEWGVGQNINDVIWYDDPQQLDNVNQKFQWVSTRKYRFPKQDETTLGGNTLDHNKKYWFNYSNPQLWNWYVNNGTNAPQIAMVYQRNNSGTIAPGVPNIVNNKVKTSKIYSYSNASHGSWASSPGNSNDNYSYLWMTSIYYTSSETGTDGHNNELDLTYINYTVDNYTWQTPVCLTGEPGHDGEDGTDIEFIYFRTGDDNKTFNNGWDNFTGDSSLADWPFVGTQGTSYYIIDGVKTLSNQDHDAWTDNPFGVSTTYDYEYASIRKKVDGTWGDFCQPFLWSKYGEDGVDGDGVEYIYYCPATTTLIDWANSNYNNINPSLWDATTSEFQASEYYVSPWSDDPQIVGEDNKYEYVSQRKKRKITDSNKSNFDSSWTTGNSFTKNEQTYNVGDMVWFPYSIPALWANYAKDGLATNLVLETDNDSVTIGIDSNGLANNNYQDTTTFRLVYNTRPLTLSSDYTLSMSNPDNNLFDLSNNILSFKSSSDFSGTFAELSGNTLTITVPEGFDMNEYDNILPITFTATIINNNIDGLDYNTTAIFTLKITAVELTLNDIYKLNIDKLVVSPNPNNDGYETLNISLKSLTSTNSITTKIDADNNHLKVYYTPYRLKTGEDTSGQNNQVTNFSNYSLNYSYVKHKFELIYNNGNNDILLDTETISAVFDGEQGNPGVDSKAQEYIYMLTSDIDFFENTSLNNYYKPQNWNNTNVDDYPFNTSSPTTIGGISYVKSVNNISGNGIIDTINDLVIAYWTDNPQGVSDEYPYEWWSIRSYDTSNEVWESFSKPVIRANWGHSGEDGDGVEYIYYKNDSETFDGPDPNNWTNDEDFQSSEYINDEVNLSEYYGSYVNQYLTFKALGSGNITLTIPANVGISYVTSVSYRKNNGRWQTTNNSSSDTTITVPVVANDVVEWKGTATKYSNGITTDNYNDTTQNLSTYASNFDATCNYNIYGNIMSLLHGDNFVNKIELTTEFTFAGLFGTYNTSRTTLKNAENLVLPAIILTNGCYTYMFACNNGLKTCPKILPYRGIGLLHMYRSMFANCCKASELATELVEAPLILCKGSTNNNYWMYRMFGSAQYINKVELWIDYYYNPNTSSHKRYGFDYFLQNNTTNGTIIQHGSADLSVIYDYRDIPNNTQNEQDVSPSVQTPTYYPYNWTITKNAGTLVWTDNPSGVSETDKYEWVSVRKYKEVTEDDTELLTNFDVGQKAWHPYSEPKLWAKYGETGPQGPAGESGSSGFIIDFDNDNLQLAVNNSNNTIKGDNFTYTLINLYSGTQKISYNDYSVSILHSSLMFNDNPLGYIVKCINSNQYYTPAADSDYIPEDINNWDNGYYFYIKTIEGSPTDDSIVLDTNNRIQFKISYNDLDYAKSISIKPIHFGADGAPAETFELMLNSDDFKFDQQGNPTPSTVTAKIKHRTGRNVEILSYEQLYTTYTDDTWAISYFNHPLNAVDTRPINTEAGETVIGGKKGGEGVSSEISGGIGDGAGSGTATGKDQETQSNISVSTTTYSDVAEILEMGNNASPDYITWNLYMNGSLIDFETTYAIYDGSNGRDGFGEEFIYSLTYLSDNNTEDPSTWYNESNASSYTDVDYIPDDQQSYWFDHPQGITLSQPVEWTSHRTWNTLGYWNPYESPVKWSHYGQDGRDGDGVEYIFAVGNSYDWEIALDFDNVPTVDPRMWIINKTGGNRLIDNISDFQQSEYIINTSVWKDDPIQNLDEGQYQFVSVRKYKIFTQEDYNSIAINGTWDPLNKFGVDSTPANVTTIKNFFSSYIGKKIWMPYSEPTIWSSNIPGQPGQNGSNAVVLDWTNDQINLAVDENGKIYNGVEQEKSTTLKLLNSGDLTIDNLNCDNYNRNYFEIILTTGEEDLPINDTKININSSYSSNDKDFTINIYIDANFNEDITIPENGLEITFEVTLSNHTTISKVLKICGQHIPSDGHDGQNAVTYELDVMPNSLSYSSFSQNANVTINALKYNGTSVTRLSTSEDFAANNIYFTTSFYDITFTYSVTDTYNQSNSKSIPKTFRGRDIYNTRYAVIKMYHYDGSTYTQIDSETIPVIYDGEQGAQGFTGPIVRMRGEWTANTKYGNGEYNSNYDGTSLLYKDIVIWTGHYMTPKSSSKYITTNNDTSGLCKGSAYVSSNTFSANEWTKATQYDFIATKLLYADQALINQISTHDLIATNSDGYPVAGVTSGSKMYDKNNTEIVSYLSTLGDVNYSENDISSQNDPSNVRIFAGEIYNSDDNSYSLTYAPFNVRQDGTAYMSKANIVGDVKIGGQVNIGGNVNIEGNAKVKADVSVNTLTLNSGSFIINSNCNLPNFNVNEHKMFYVLIHKQDNNVCYINPQNNQSILATDTNGNFKNYDPGTSIELQNHGLYTAISTYMNDMSYWVVSKTGVYAVPSSRQTYRKIFSKGYIDENPFIYISNIEIQDKKVIKCTFTTNGNSAPSSDKNGFDNVQSIFIYCSLNQNSYYQVGIRSNNHWIYNSLTPDEILPSRNDNDTSFNISHHYMSGSNSVNGWNNNTDIHVELVWNDPTEQESGYDGLSVDAYRILYYHNDHGWRHNISNVNTDAISGGDYSISNQPDKFNYYVEIVYYN